MFYNIFNFTIIIIITNLGGPGEVGGLGQLPGLVPAEHVEVVRVGDGGAVPPARRHLHDPHPVQRGHQPAHFI